MRKKTLPRPRKNGKALQKAKILNLSHFLWEQTPGIKILMNQKMFIQDINSEGLTYFQLDKHTIIHDPLTNLLSRKEINALQKTLYQKQNMRLLHKNNKPLICSLNPIYKNNPRVLSGYLLVGNVEETVDELRVRFRIAHRRYLETNSLLQNLLDSSPGLIYWKDQDGNYLGVNQYWCKTLGLTKKEAVGFRDKDLLEKEVAEQLRANDIQVMESGLTLQTEENGLKGGKEIIYMSYKSPLRDEDNNIVGVIGTSLDISELKRTQKELLIAKEKAEAANQTKANFIATISHEIRTPMNVILGMAQILESKLSTQEQLDCVETILKSGKNLLELINDILDYSKLEAHKLEIKPAPFDFNKLIQETADTIKYKLAEKKIPLIFNPLGRIPPLVIGDELRIRQILLNLLTNSAKFTEKGYIKLIVHTRKRKDNTWFKIIVEDTGIGISKKNQEMVFERFKQVDSNYRRRFQGTGLGLAIVKSLVEAMHGKIGMESELGKGSSFWFSLSLKTCKKIAKPPVVEKEPLPVFFKRNYSPKILVVEDNRLNQKVIKILLNELNCQVTIAESGEEAIKFYRKERFHLIFMDIGLPRMSGLEAIEAIRKIKNKNRGLPIIALTAHMGEENEKICKFAGANDTITKPVLRQILIKTLDINCPIDEPG